MRFFYQNKKILTTNDTIYLQDVILDVGAFSVEKIFRICEKFVHENHIKIFYIVGKPSIYSLYDYILLLVLAKNKITIYDFISNQPFDITLLYHFSLEIENGFIDFCFKNIEIVFETQSISLCYKEEFLLTDVSDKERFEYFYKHFKSLLIKNRRKYNIIDDKDVVSEILQNWKDYCFNRFSVCFSNTQMRFFHMLYQQKGFKTRSLILDKRIVAQGIVYYSDITNTVYFCIFWWDNQFKKDSIGRYIYLEEISRCHFSKMKYSFCYGLQDYKCNIVKFFN
ncbi:hypothetical protein [Streptococcus mitis]|uniref:hypothetical protein n=1 Tax=Streptococcus mitis TaxID=28037 RepID=UPI0019313CAF|nr:hypothetical protein [Streptococcus mitis]